MAACRTHLVLSTLVFFLLLRRNRGCKCVGLQRQTLASVVMTLARRWRPYDRQDAIAMPDQYHPPVVLLADTRLVAASVSPMLQGFLVFTGFVMSEHITVGHQAQPLTPPLCLNLNRLPEAKAAKALPCGPELARRLRRAVCLPCSRRLI